MMRAGCRKESVFTNIILLLLLICYKYRISEDNILCYIHDTALKYFSLVLSSKYFSPWLYNYFLSRERVINSTRGSLEEISLQGLLPGTTYTVRVLAHSEQGPGSSSPPLTITTQPEVELPGPPVNISARPTSAFSILVTWDSPDNAAGVITKYRLYHRRVSWTTFCENWQRAA